MSALNCNRCIKTSTSTRKSGAGFTSFKSADKSVERHQFELSTAPNIFPNLKGYRVSQLLGDQSGHYRYYDVLMVRLLTVSSRKWVDQEENSWGKTQSAGLTACLVNLACA
jgi:hypothetical protein